MANPYGYISMMARGPEGLFKQYGLELERMHYAHCWTVKLEHICRRIDHEFIDECMRDPKRIAYLRDTMERELEAYRQKDMMAMIPPVEYKAAMRPYFVNDGVADSINQKTEELVKAKVKAEMQLKEKKMQKLLLLQRRA